VLGVVLSRMQTGILGVLDHLLSMCPAFSSSEDKVKFGRRAGSLALLRVRSEGRRICGEWGRHKLWAQW
jgi:hypothetical protein